MESNVEFCKGEVPGVFFTVYRDDDNRWKKTYWCTLDIAKSIIEGISDLREISYFGSDETQIYNFDPGEFSKVSNVSKEHLRRIAVRIQMEEKTKLNLLADNLGKELKDLDDINIYPKYGKEYAKKKFALLNQPMLNDVINSLKRPDKRSVVEDNSDLIFKKFWMRKKYKDVIFEKSSDEYFISFTKDNRETIKNLIDAMEETYFQKFNVYYFILSSLKSQNTLLRYLVKEFEVLIELSKDTDIDFINKYNDLKKLSQVFPTSKAINAVRYFYNINKIAIPNFSYKNINKILHHISLPNQNELLMISRGDDIEKLVQLLRQHFVDVNNQFKNINFKVEVEEKIKQEIVLSRELLLKIYEYTNL